MNELLNGMIGETLESIEIVEDPDQEPGDYMAYRITIKTSQRTLVIKGCHDMGPELTDASQNLA